MAVRFYDQALVDKINGWIKNPNVTVLKPDEITRLIQQEADQNRDKITLPLIAISRASDIELDFSHKKPMSFDGRMLKATNTYSYSLNAIPMRLQYQLDIYTRYSDEGDEYLRNFIFNLINHPALTIELPYNDLHFEHESNISLDSTISDNSDIPQRLFNDQFTRWTLVLNINDAYLFSIAKYDTLSANLESLEIDDLDEETENL